MKEMLYAVRCLKSNEFFRFMRQLLRLSSKCEDHSFDFKHRTAYNISFILKLLYSSGIGIIHIHIHIHIHTLY